MLSSTASRTTATGSDSASVYPYQYRIFQPADLLVTVKNLTTLQETVLTFSVDYTVQNVGQQTGTITLQNLGQVWLDGSGYLSSSYMMVVRRVRPLTQNVSIRNQGSFYAATHEDEFDNLVMIDQQHWDQISRSVRTPETITPAQFNPILPSNLPANPGSTIAVNPSGNGWALVSPITGFSWSAIDIPFTAFQAASLTNQIVAFPLPPNCILIGCALKHWTAFAGTSITDVFMDLGIVGNENLLLNDFDVFQAVGDQVFLNALVQYIGSFASNTNIMIQATAVGANLSALSAGSVRVYYYYLNLGV